MRAIFALAAAIIVINSPAIADDREQIGTGRLFTNDILGDGSDRWRTGSYVYSHVRGYGPYSGSEGFGDLVEYRIRSEIIAPTRGTTAPGDRPYVGMVSLGAHTHFSAIGAEFSLGADIAAIGPQTGLSQFQELYHDTFSLPNPPHTDEQLPNRVFLNGTAAVSKSFDIASGVTLRPFVEGLTGTEDLLRAGADLSIGPAQSDVLLVRDVVTGQLYSGTPNQASGLSYVMGADIASVFDSAFLPADQGYEAEETRVRARAGVHWGLGAGASLFYGATYLSPEFKGQGDGQVVGSVKLIFNF